MKDKILLAIKAKFPTAKLTAKRLDALAATIEAKAGTDETLIDPTLDALNELYPVADIAKDDHVRATLEGRLKATQTKGETPEEKAAREAVEGAIGGDDTNALLRSIVESNKTLAAQVAAMQGERVANTLRAKIDEQLKGKVPEKYWSKIPIPANEEGIEAYVAERVADWAEINQAQTDAGLGAMGMPRTAGQQQQTGATKAVSPEIKVFTERQAAANQNGAAKK